MASIDKKMTETRAETENVLRDYIQTEKTLVTREEKTEVSFSSVKAKMALGREQADKAIDFIRLGDKEKSKNKALAVLYYKEALGFAEEAYSFASDAVSDRIMKEKRLVSLYNFAINEGFMRFLDEAIEVISEQIEKGVRIQKKTKKLLLDAQEIAHVNLMSRADLDKEDLLEMKEVVDDFKKFDYFINEAVRSVKGYDWDLDF